MPDLREQLERCCQGRVCLIGIGSADYGDDAFGVRLAEELITAGMPDVIVAGASPERFIGEIPAASFDNVIFLDAVELGVTPGALVLLDSTQVTTWFPQVSTHKISLGLLTHWIESNGFTKAWLLAVQPQSIRQGSPFSETMQNSLHIVRDLLIGVRKKELEIELASAGQE